MEEKKGLRRHTLLTQETITKILTKEVAHDPDYSFYYIDPEKTVVQFTNIIFNSGFIINKIAVSEIFFENCTVSAINVNNVNNIGIYFYYTDITTEISIQKSALKSLRIDEKSSLKNISLDSSKLDLFIKDSTIGKINTWFKTTLEYFLINTSRIGEITINQDSSITTLTADSSVNIEEINVDNAFIKNIALTNNSTINAFRATKCISSGAINIYNSEIKQWHIQKSQLGYISIINSYIIQSGLIESKIFSYTINNSQNDRLYINKSFIQETIISTNKRLNLVITNSTAFNFIIFSCLLNKDSYITISACLFNTLALRAINNAGILVFNEINTIRTESLFTTDNNTLLVDDNNTFVFSEKTQDPTIKIIVSDLGKAQFIGCDFRKFDKFEYHNSKMLEVFVADTEFPEREKISHPNAEVTETQKLEQQRLALSQFKKIYENRGDNIRATQALAEEIETYRAQLKLEKPTTKKERWNNRTERLNLWLNRISNYHGNNWFRAATVTILIDWLFFYLYSLSLGFRLGGDWNMFGKLFASSFDFLNPVHKTDFLVDRFDFTLDIGGLALFIDNISRIIIAYLVYQTIAAFRKFGKKSG